MEIKKCILTNNDCYRVGQKITPKGIVVHSTGANNPNLRRYVQPDDGLLGTNIYNNHWNKTGIEKCVHAFIGKDKNGVVRVYQTLPFNYACWGVGSGKNGSYNYSPAYIQFEICEDDLTDKAYFEKAFALAIEFCSYLCKEYNISVDNVISHKEAHSRGYGSNHGDCDHWLKKFGKDMNWFRNEVKSKLNNTLTPVVSSIKKGDRVKVNKGAKSYEGKSISSFVYNNTYTVDQISGSRAVLDKNGICTAFNLKDLTIATTVPKAITVGSKVKVVKGAKSYEGKTVASFVYNNVYTVDQLNGTRAVLDIKGICTAFRTSDLIVQ